MKPVLCEPNKAIIAGRPVGRLVLVALGCAGLVLSSQTARPAALTTSAISFGPNVTFDSFDSGDTNYSTGGLYDPAKSKDHGDVFTTGPGFSLGGQSWIMGHVRTGPGGSVLTSGQSSIGSKSWVQGGHREWSPAGSRTTGGPVGQR